MCAPRCVCGRASSCTGCECTKDETSACDKGLQSWAEQGETIIRPPRALYPLRVDVRHAVDMPNNGASLTWEGWAPPSSLGCTRGKRVSGIYVKRGMLATEIWLKMARTLACAPENHQPSHHTHTIRCNSIFASKLTSAATDTKRDHE